MPRFIAFITSSHIPYVIQNINHVTHVVVDMGTLKRGAKVGKVRIARKIGEGQFAEVYRAYHKDLKVIYLNFFGFWNGW